ncbi:MAG: NAD(P)-binding protein, partial [Bacteroidales bacterium]|nr:NAD(P)-binding protein [Bacteroidales bacterium]
MVKININGTELTVENELTIYEEARRIGIEIPVMCYNRESGHFASCMVCVVKDAQSGKMIPSCSVRVAEGMSIVTDDNEIHEARRTALELLLSEHTGDCEAPCQIACPAHMNIPLMNRLLAQGKVNEALDVVGKDIAFPSVLGRICSAPCEGACRRKSIDHPVEICLLKRFAGDHGHWKPEPLTLNGKKVAVIGGGPAGLAAAFYLQMKGIQTIVYDRNTEPGGALMFVLPEEQLEKSVVRREIDRIKETGVKFVLNTE